jgi:hypothetical protein
MVGKNNTYSLLLFGNMPAQISNNMAIQANPMVYGKERS